MGYKGIGYKEILKFYTPIPLYPYTFIPLYPYTLIPLYPYTLIPLPYTLIPFPIPYTLYPFFPSPCPSYFGQCIQEINSSFWNEQATVSTSKKSALLKNF